MERRLEKRRATALLEAWCNGKKTGIGEHTESLIAMERPEKSLAQRDFSIPGSRIGEINVAVSRCVSELLQKVQSGYNT